MKEGNKGQEREEQRERGDVKGAEGGREGDFECSWMISFVQ